MKVLFFDCSMGVSGDMLLSSLIGLFDDKEEVLKNLNSIGVPDTVYSLSRVKKCGIGGNKVSVRVHGEEEGGHGDGSLSPFGETQKETENRPHVSQNHPHVSHGRSIKKISEIVGDLNLSDAVKEDVLKVYGLIAEAESRVHGEEVSEIHFHELGNLDAVADIAGVSYLLSLLSPERIVSGPLNLGSGTVKCAHGILSVPAPAVSELIQGMETYSDGIQGELTTPTGAALIKYFADSFGSFPLMKVTAKGTGMGTKDFERPNCLTVFFGEVTTSGTGALRDRVVEMTFNVDDMTPEETGFATEVLLSEGALDVYTVPAGMKKNRPGLEITLLCKEEDRARFETLIFKNTSTIGIRESVRERAVLKRDEEEVKTSFGPVRIKRSEGEGIVREKIEYEDASRIAREQGTGLREAKELIRNEITG